MSATDTPLLPILGQDGTADRPTTGCVDRNKQASLLDALLFEQQQPTALDRFGRLLETGALPVQARYYQSLIPATAPEAGEQYAFEVDLDAAGRAAVIAALAMHESFRSGGDSAAVAEPVGAVVPLGTALGAVQVLIGV